ncbi:MAG: virulence RhuM family protein [Patescibacteria group bacterium]
MKNIINKDIVIYKDKDGQINLEAKLDKETIWLSQAQMALLFGTQRPAVTKHLVNIFQSGELKQNSVCSKMEHTASDGKTYQTIFYNLDAILSVGYRVNSKQATHFRIWATQLIKKYLVSGYLINEKRLRENKEIRLIELTKTIDFLRNISAQKRLSQGETEGLLQIIATYANSWAILQKYDSGNLKIQKVGKIIKVLDYDFVKNEISKLKLKLIKDKQASENFAKEKVGNLADIFKRLEQSFSPGKSSPSVAERAAYILYFIIKERPFIDGNKRIASFLFIIYLVKNNYLLNKKGEAKINDNALASLALLIANSQSKEKKLMIALVTNLLAN